ncbi:hypothetical protein AX17_004657 [Amanita inopinata Kibby_2008]|nr:hypothetical protein AX17_004657 [Amanita inopinata Kibby_2008]
MDSIYMVTTEGESSNGLGNHLGLSQVAFMSLQCGNIFNWWLYGALTVQVYLYYIAFPKDKISTKIVVYTVYLLETIYTAVLTIDLLSSVDRKLYITKFAVPILGGSVTFIAECLYAYRIYLITRSKFLSGSWLRYPSCGICALAILQFLGAILFALGLFNVFHTKVSIPSNTDDIFFWANLDTPVWGYIWTGSSAICDVAIAVIMVYLLMSNGTILKETRSKMVRLVRLIIETGSMTATVNLVTLVLLTTARRTGSAHIAPMIILPKVYANSILVLFNNRISITGGRNETSTMIDAGSFAFAHQDNSAHRGGYHEKTEGETDSQVELSQSDSAVLTAENTNTLV